MENPDTLLFEFPKSVEAQDLLELDFVVNEYPVSFSITDYSPNKFTPLVKPNPRDVRLLSTMPWVRTVGKFDLSITTEGWKFPAPPVDVVRPPVEEKASTAPPKLTEPID